MKEKSVGRIYNIILMHNCLTGLITNFSLVQSSKKSYDEGQTEGRAFNNCLVFSILVFSLNCNWEWSNAFSQSVFCA